MKKILYLIMYMPLLWLSACDVHELPETPEFVKLHLRLNYEMDMTIWNHQYDGESVIEQGFGETYDNRLESGRMRYIVRTYPISEEQRTMQDYTQEFVFSKDIAEGYDHEVTLDVLPGNYHVMVWSDLVETNGDSHFYNADSFLEIMWQGDHKGNTAYHDAFCGKNMITLSVNNSSQINRTINICMKRPLARFEIIANDLLEFTNLKGSDLSLYKAKIEYIGFVPNTYSLFADRPVSSTTGEMFESSLTKLTDTEISMGFDHVLASDKGTTVTVRIGIYDNNDQPISFSKSLTIPIMPAYHTLLKGKFLMQNTSNKVDISPNWNGDYNITL